MQKTLLPFTVALVLISASAYAQAIESPISDNVPNSVTALNTQQIDSSHLNPAFVLPASDVAALIQKGQNAYQDHRALSDVVKPYVQAPVDINGEKWRSHLSSVLFYGDNGIGTVLTAYDAAKQSQPLPLPPALLSQGAVINSADFHVVLHAGLHSLKEATPNDVTATKFFLTDDAGDTIQSLAPSTSGVQTANQVIHGASVSSTTNTVSTVNGSSTSSAPINGVVTGSGDQISIQSTQTPQPVPTTDTPAPDTQTNSWSTTLSTTSIPGASTHPYYDASYDVSFPLFDSSGQPLVQANAKVLTLHIITPNGELDTTYKLHAIKP